MITAFQTYSLSLNLQSRVANVFNIKPLKNADYGNFPRFWALWILRRAFFLPRSPLIPINMKKVILALFLGAFLTSCMVTRTTIGDGPIGKDPNAKVVSQVKQGYVLRGLVPIGTKQVQIPITGGYQLRTSHKFVDGLITGLTFGIYTQQTIEVLQKK